MVQEVRKTRQVKASLAVLSPNLQRLSTDKLAGDLTITTTSATTTATITDPSTTATPRPAGVM
ncbi:hypothetical protein E2C01_061677 [Portunus trituberculatus]|uniref:Uncharacterized protein n=1 Tax=Portunus trituberculatus TaxID=210409 RepID=A0A5B7H5W3_PORTR|nr:hypothetical protein [Portunus trituberculatus]